MVILGDHSPDLRGSASAEPSTGVATRRNQGGFWTGALIGSLVREDSVDLLNPDDVLHRRAKDENSAWSR